MTIQDKTKYQLMLKLKNGEILTSKRSWLVKDTAMQHLKNTLDTDSFEWGTLLVLNINDSLIDCEEYYYEAF